MRGELEGRESDRREARDALRASEVAVSNANRSLKAQEAAAREAREEIGRIGTRRGEQERALQAQQEALGRVLAARAMAELSGHAPDVVRVALSGEDLGDAARRLHYLAYISRDAAQVIDAQRAGLAELARLREASEGKARELAAIEIESRGAREQLLRERREQQRVLERVSAEMRSMRRLV
jgi:septal ring factor EnvC (AmiA/AmiB activator)